MSPDTGHVLPSKWKDFLREIDQLLGVAVEIHCLGGFVLSALYDLPRPTGDVDYIAAMPSHSITELESIAGQGSALNRKHRLYLQYVTVADVPEDYAERLEKLFPGEFMRLRLFALEVHDLVLARTGRLNETVLKQRYKKELRPYLANEKRHDLTLKLWLEACFHS
jgi:hypothetical protein